MSLTSYRAAPPRVPNACIFKGASGKAQALCLEVILVAMET